MNLSMFLSSLERGGKTKFANKINVSKSFLRQMETGKTPVPPQTAKKIESASNGLVTKEDLRPDLWNASERG